MSDVSRMVESTMKRACAAAGVFTQLDQEQTDSIVRAVYLAALDKRVELAKLAAEETQMGIWRDKVIKNVVATQLIYEDIKNTKTVGIVSDDKETGILEIAQPLGPVLCVIPTTNPTSTVIFKILIALKTRNPVIISPHSRASRCSIAAAKICYEAALTADAPEDCIQWLEPLEDRDASRERTQLFMRHPKLALILATGGGGLVKEAYSSGTPAFGVGAGNVPVFVERSAEIPFVVGEIMSSKCFDNGTICASEQAIVVEKIVAGRLRAEFEKSGARFLNDDEALALAAVAFDTKSKLMNAKIVGRPAPEIARLAGISCDENTTLLVAPLKGVGDEYPLSSEILAPIIAWYEVGGPDEALNLCIDLNYHGGAGHTASIFSNDEKIIREFSSDMNAGRIVVNMPSSQGAVGGIYNKIRTSLTLGCGSGGKNITTDNISACHLLNIQRITKRRLNERFFRFDKSLYFDESLPAVEIEKEYNKNY